MPELRTINAQADAALARAAEFLRGDEEFLERLANAAFLRCVEPDSEHGARHARRGGVLEAAGGAGAASRRGMRSKPPTRRERMA